ncbi:hypothetical protein Trydic_g20745 [Trypoxylus dichotomus]
MNTAGVRRRKDPKQREQNGRSVQKAKKKSSNGSSIRQSLLCLIVSGVVLTVFMFLYIDYIPWHLHHRAIDKVVKVFGYYEPVHAVVIDAGSTGSRVLAFSFHKAYLDGHLILEKELFVHTKPGLSSYVDNPEAGAATIASLIEKAKDEIPKQYWSSTPLILKATAGLRLLPTEKADALLKAVKDLFDRTPFLTDNESVAIMDGTDEGIFSWFTVNFLLVDFDKCAAYVEDYVKSIAQPPVELPDKRIYAFSYYFDRAADVGLIDESTGGRVKVSDFKGAAKKVCNEANADQPFMCLDLTFIWILLEKGFGLRLDTTVFLYKKILGHEISWALGSAYSLLQG